MSSEVVKQEAKVVEITPEDIKKYIAPTATDKELFMFLGIARSYGLNPMKREIHFVKYGTNPGQTVVGYESYIKKAERTGLLDGWECKIISEGQKAEITIWRKDRTKPFTWEVDRKEFDKGQSTWKAMPNFMLKKVCISQGFRLCFSEDLGGMPYIPEEINGHSSEELSKEKPEEPQGEKASPPKETNPSEEKPKVYRGTIKSVEEKFSEKTKRNYWPIKTSTGDYWTGKKEIADKASQAKLIDAEMEWTVNDKGMMITLEVAQE